MMNMDLNQLTAAVGACANALNRIESNATDDKAFRLALLETLNALVEEQKRANEMLAKLFAAKEGE